jgi:hypothetical protein
MVENPSTTAAAQAAAEEKPYKGKVYQSINPARGIYLPGGSGTGAKAVNIRFRPDPSTKSKLNPTGFGVLDTNDKHLLQRLGGAGGPASPKVVEAAVESEPDYVNRKPGKAGIWPAEELTFKSGSESISQIRAELIALGEAVLRRKLADGKVATPVKASANELAVLVIEAVAEGKIQL